MLPWVAFARYWRILERHLRRPQCRPSRDLPGMKTLFLSITHGFQARDLLRTDVLQTLLAAGVRVVILTPNHRDPVIFVREFNRPGVVLEPLHTDVGRLEAAMGTSTVCPRKLQAESHAQCLE